MSLGTHFDGTTHSFDGQDLSNDKHFPSAKLILICICGGRGAISLRQLALCSRKSAHYFQLKFKSTCGDVSVNVNGERTKGVDRGSRSAGSNRHEAIKCWSCSAHSEYDPYPFFRLICIFPSLSVSLMKSNHDRVAWVVLSVPGDGEFFCSPHALCLKRMQKNSAASLQCCVYAFRDFFFPGTDWLTWRPCSS